MKTLGIIGGLGPSTTARFYLELITLCEKYNKIHRPAILIWNVPISYKMEQDEIINGVYSEKMPSLLIAAAKKLENAGADFLVMPCNSSHLFIEEIQKRIKIPMLNMINETTKYLLSKNVKRTAFISSIITRDNSLYLEQLQHHGIEVKMPTLDQQFEINKIVLNITSNICQQTDRNKLLEIVNYFYKNGLRHLVLACAALEQLSPQHSHVEIHDTMKIFANATADKILSNS